MSLQKTSNLEVSNEFPLDGPFHSENFLPISSIIDPTHTNLEDMYAKDKLLFCFRAVLKTIDSYLAGKYTDFDGHTTSNCCHGMSLLALNLINSVHHLDLNDLRHEGEQKIQALEQAAAPQPCTWWVPKSLVNLTSLYILNYIKESDPIKGDRTIVKRLMNISPLSPNACKLIAYPLQKRFSNWIAMKYDDLVEEIGEMHISGAPLSMWGKYISSDYLRTDKRGITYASNLFSMQVVFAALIRSEAKVALINDIMDFSGNLKGRYVSLFAGDGQGFLRKLSKEEIKNLSLFNQKEPVIVYGGCMHSDTQGKADFSLQMQAWDNSLPGLLLSCDVFYPQFSQVKDDPDFDNTPIVPEEELLQKILEKHAKVKGVSANDPSFYCATHIYPASMSQVLKVLNEQSRGSLPISYIPDCMKNA